jgi:hypothetical protein
VIAVLTLLFTYTAALACSGDYYNIPAGVAQTIDECGTCRIVTNNGAKNIFIPTKTNGEWQAFIANATANTGGNVVFTACGSSCTYPLDSIPTPGAAYSTRRLRTAYSGPLLRVRRSSDNAEQDISADAAGCGPLDLTALNTFVGANSAFVKTWYDQSGNGINITQATNANQPRIMNAGVLDETTAGKPAVRWFDATGARLMEAAAPFTSANELTVNLVFKEVVRQNSWAWILAVDGDPGGRISTHITWSDGRIYYDLGGCCASPQRVSGVTPYAVGSTNVYSYVNSVSQNTKIIYGNGSAIITGVVSTATVARVRLGSNGTNAMNAAMSEFLVFPSLLTSGDRRTIELNQKTFYGTP